MTKDEYEKLPPYIKRNLQSEGVFPDELEKVSPKGQPYTNMGVMNSPEYSTSLGGGTQGVTFEPKDPKLPTSDRSSFRVYNKKEIEREPCKTAKSPISRLGSRFLILGMSKVSFVSLHTGTFSSIFDKVKPPQNFAHE